MRRDGSRRGRSAGGRFRGGDERPAHVSDRRHAAVDLLRRAIAPEVRFYRPEEGPMFLFPSYFYHRTVSFESEQPRVSIAFDILRDD